MNNFWVTVAVKSYMIIRLILINMKKQQKPYTISMQIKLKITIVNL